ncbi:MAG: beta-N-acetylhexosaminidase [Lysobacterales bacterium]
MAYLIIGLAGPELQQEEQAWLAHPAVGGVIVFARNWQNPEQMRELTNGVRECCPNALIMVDQEGGRVQRCGLPLTSLPALGRLGEVFDQNPQDALALANAHGELMASEVISLGIDISLAPVLDIDGGSAVIGDRGLHAKPSAVAQLASAYRQGMASAGMAACGKHFPGHGTVIPDTHVDDAIDDRSLDQLMSKDLAPFVHAIDDGVEALMLAHVCYPKVCSQPAGYSSRWINEILREQLHFEGVVISDDLGMRAAHSAGDFPQRVAASLNAGCDLLLVCGPTDVAQVMAVDLPHAEINALAIERLHARPRFTSWDLLKNSPYHRNLRNQIQCLI